MSRARQVLEEDPFRAHRGAALAAEVRQAARDGDKRAALARSPVVVDMLATTLARWPTREAQGGEEAQEEGLAVTLAALANMFADHGAAARVASAERTEAHPLSALASVLSRMYGGADSDPPGRDKVLRVGLIAAANFASVSDECRQALLASPTCDVLLRVLRHHPNVSLRLAALTAITNMAESASVVDALLERHELVAMFRGLVEVCRDSSGHMQAVLRAYESIVDLAAAAASGTMDAFVDAGGLALPLDVAADESVPDASRELAVRSLIAFARPTRQDQVLRRRAALLALPELEHVMSRVLGHVPGLPTAADELVTPLAGGASGNPYGLATATIELHNHLTTACASDVLQAMSAGGVLGCLCDLVGSCALLVHSPVPELGSDSGQRMKHLINLRYVGVIGLNNLAASESTATAIVCGHSFHSVAVDMLQNRARLLPDEVRVLANLLRNLALPPGNGQHLARAGVAGVVESLLGSERDMEVFGMLVAAHRHVVWNCRAVAEAWEAAVLPQLVAGVLRLDLQHVHPVVRVELARLVAACMRSRAYAGVAQGDVAASRGLESVASVQFVAFCLGAKGHDAVLLEGLEALASCGDGVLSLARDFAASEPVLEDGQGNAKTLCDLLRPLCDSSASAPAVATCARRVAERLCVR